MSRNLSTIDHPVNHVTWPRQDRFTDLAAADHQYQALVAEPRLISSTLDETCEVLKQ
jgi:hypothetical protein